jgi:hypothetical protein
VEKVYTIESVHDGRPLSGLADYEGRPHVYQCQFNEELDDWSDQYFLRQIDTDLLALERHEIFLRWRAAFDAAKTTLNTHPALPSDRARYDGLQVLINDRLAAPPEVSVRMSGHFHAATDGVTWRAGDKF